MEDFDATLYATMRPARGGKSLVTLSTYQERQEALNRTSIMEDDTSHRTSRYFPIEKSSITDTVEIQPQQNHQQSVPPPPPQFANSPPKNQSNNIYGTYYQTIKKASSTAPTTATSNGTRQQSSVISTPKPPNSPIPDYDNVDFRKGRQVQMANDVNASHNKNTSSTSSSTNSNTNRRTMRLGAVTIGEYGEQQRKEPAKFEFVGNKNRETSNGFINARNIDNLHSELHDTLSRSKLKNDAQIEHQRDCPLRNGYANGSSVDQLTRKIQGAHISQKHTAENNSEGTATIKRQNSNTINGTSTGTGTGTGILKNGNSRTNGSSNNGINGHSAKMIEKTITFGN